MIMGLKKKLWVKKNLWVRRHFGSENLISKVIFGPKTLGPKEHRVQKDIRSKNYLSPKAILSAIKDDKSNLGLKKMYI